MFLGIDTSAYTTSLAVVDIKGTLIFDKRILLPVPPGKQGLQQSTALFYHIKNLPKLTEELFKTVDSRDLTALAVSQKPLPREASYLPVFTAGSFLAETMACILRIPLVKTTHQEGHLTAGLWSAGAGELPKFLALHLSGGTTELLLVERTNSRPLEFSIDVLGSSMDIHAGQLIDRVGVAIGLSFPAGPGLESLAREGELSDQAVEEREKLIIGSSVRGYSVSFSGAETRAKDLLNKQASPAAVARAVEHCIALAVTRIARRAIEETGFRDILVVGGVAANSYIRRFLIKKLEHPAVGGRLYFPHPDFSRDNAVGVSLIAHSSHI